MEVGAHLLDTFRKVSGSRGWSQGGSHAILIRALQVVLEKGGGRIMGQQMEVEGIECLSVTEELGLMILVAVEWGRWR